MNTDFLTLLAFTKIEYGRYKDAESLLEAVRMLEPKCTRIGPLLALVKLNGGNPAGCLQSLDVHENLFGAADCSRQLAWLRIRALYACERIAESNELVRKLRSEDDSTMPIG